MVTGSNGGGINISSGTDLTLSDVIVSGNTSGGNGICAGICIGIDDGLA